MDEKPTKDFTTNEKLDHILFRIDKIEDLLDRMENDHAREMRKLDSLLAAIHKLQEDLREVKGSLSRLES